jgi:hypothetical protein
MDEVGVQRVIEPSCNFSTNRVVGGHQDDSLGARSQNRFYGEVREERNHPSTGLTGDNNDGNATQFDPRQ